MAKWENLQIAKWFFFLYFNFSILQFASISFNLYLIWEFFDEDSIREQYTRNVKEKKKKTLNNVENIWFSYIWLTNADMGFSSRRKNAPSQWSRWEKLGLGRILRTTNCCQPHLHHLHYHHHFYHHYHLHYLMGIVDLPRIEDFPIEIESKCFPRLWCVCVIDLESLITCNQV